MGFFSNHDSNTKKRGGMFGGNKERSGYGGFQSAGDLNKSGFFGNDYASQDQRKDTGNSFFGGDNGRRRTRGSPRNGGGRNFFGGDTNTERDRGAFNSSNDRGRGRGGFFGSDEDRKMSPIEGRGGARSGFFGRNEDKNGSFGKKNNFNFGRDARRTEDYEQKFVNSFLKEYKGHFLKHPSITERIATCNIVSDADYGKHVKDIRTLRMNDYASILKFSRDKREYSQAGKELCNRLHQGLMSLEADAITKLVEKGSGGNSERDSSSIFGREKESSSNIFGGGSNNRERHRSRDQRSGFFGRENDDKSSSTLFGKGDRRESSSGGMFGRRDSPDKGNGGFFGNNGKTRERDERGGGFFGGGNEQSNRDQGSFRDNNNQQGAFFGNRQSRDQGMFRNKEEPRGNNYSSSSNNGLFSNRGASGSRFTGQNGPSQSQIPQGVNPQLQNEFMNLTIGMMHQTIMQQAKIMESIKDSKTQKEDPKPVDTNTFAKMKDTYTNEFIKVPTGPRPGNSDRFSDMWNDINTPVCLNYNPGLNHPHCIPRRRKLSHVSNLPRIKKSYVTRNTKKSIDSSNHNFSPILKRDEFKSKECGVSHKPNFKFVKIKVKTLIEEKQITLDIGGKNMERYSGTNFKYDIVKYLFPKQPEIHQDLVKNSTVVIAGEKVNRICLLRRYLSCYKGSGDSDFSIFSIKIPTHIRCFNYGLTENPLQNISLVANKMIKNFENESLDSDNQSLDISSTTLQNYPEGAEEEVPFTQNGFKILPNLPVLIRNEGLSSLKNIDHFCLTNDSGGIYFLEPVDISSISDFSKYVNISEKFIEVFWDPEFSFRPGNGINKSCFLVFEKLWDGKMDLKKFLKRVKKFAKKIGGCFQEMDDETKAVKINMPFLNPFNFQ